MKSGSDEREGAKGESDAAMNVAAPGAVQYMCSAAGWSGAGGKIM